MRGTSSREGRRGKKFKGEYDDASIFGQCQGQVTVVSSEEEEDDRAVTSESKKTALAEAKKSKNSSQKQKISEEEGQMIALIEQQKNWNEEEELAKAGLTPIKTSRASLDAINNSSLKK